MAIGWLTNIAEADSLFLLRLENTAWFASGMTTARKTAALTTAYKRIVYCGLFNLALTTPATAALKEAQTEMAYYLILHQAAEDRRKALQAQGVVSAGVVKESYAETSLNKVAIPATVMGILDASRLDRGGFFVASISRDEDEPITSKMIDGGDNYSNEDPLSEL